MRRDSQPAESLVDVAVMAAIRNPLTYRVPEGMVVPAGQRVLVPLGKRTAVGIALHQFAQTAPGIELRNVIRVLDPEPLLSPELLTLGLWIAEYYVAPAGEVFRAMLPLRPETQKVRRLELTETGKRKLEELEGSLLDEARNSHEATLLRYVDENPGVLFETARRKFGALASDLLKRALVEEWIVAPTTTRERTERKVFAVRLAGPIPDQPPRLSPVARRIVEALDQQGPAEDHRELLNSARASLSTLRKLNKAGVIELKQARVAGLRHSREIAALELNAAAESPAFQLNNSQQQVIGELSNRLAQRQFSVTLLHGVTASGKTEIYLHLIARCLEHGRSALMLVPEIALTPAVQAQFLRRFGERVAVLHSGLGRVERHDDWWRARRGEVAVVLGTRSAVFAPLDNLGLIVVDEEHDSSYKQEETPRYNARDAAVVRGRLAQALVVLGSATPSLESYWNTQQEKYSLCTLNERVAGRSMASVAIIDMREEFRRTQSKIPVSSRLREEIEKQLKAGAQTMILLNRRGYSWFLLCRACGETVRCVNCSISLTYHRREQKLICHYCNYSQAIPSTCPACGSEYLQYVGEGTEKIEDKFAELFPGARVARLDRDVARVRGQFQKVLADFRAGKIDILVGTQLIAKGHDFPGVTLVGVVSADQGLGLPDFRAAERTFQLLAQAAGRAGRGDAPGRVLVQTFYPDHYAIRFAAEQDFTAFYAKEMKFRRMMHYPPVNALANVIAQGSKLEYAAEIAQNIGRFLSSEQETSQQLRIFGPSPPPLARIEGRYRIQFLIKAKSRSHLNEVLRRLADYCEQQGISPRSLVIDMDPMNVM